MLEFKPPPLKKGCKHEMQMVQVGAGTILSVDPMKALHGVCDECKKCKGRNNYRNEMFEELTK